MGEREEPSVGGLRPELLGEIIISPDDPKPIGGLNPHCEAYEKIGSQFLNLLISYTGLLPTHHVLDIGCGTGRMANQFDKFINAGNYTGFDIKSEYISHCRKAFPNLKFDWWDIYHEEYNNAGVIKLEDFEFYENSCFDRIIAIAVFNHLRLSDFKHYIQQSSRMLRKNGILFFTALILNNRTIEFTKSKENHPFKFTVETDDGWFEYEDRPLFNTALLEVDVRRVLMQNGLVIQDPIRYGEWSGGPTAITGHDVVISRKI